MPVFGKIMKSSFLTVFNKQLTNNFLHDYCIHIKMNLFTDDVNLWKLERKEIDGEERDTYILLSKRKKCFWFI